MSDETNEVAEGGTPGSMPVEPAPIEPVAGAAAGEGDARSRAESRQAEWLRQLQTMIDEVATQAAPVVREVAAKATELAQRAAEVAAPYAAKAADVTADVAEMAAHKSREVAADIRAAEQRRASGAEGSAADLGSGESPAGGTEAPTTDEGGAI